MADAEGVAEGETGLAEGERLAVADAVADAATEALALTDAVTEALALTDAAPLALVLTDAAALALAEREAEVLADGDALRLAERLAETEAVAVRLTRTHTGSVPLATHVEKPTSHVATAGR